MGQGSAILKEKIGQVTSCTGHFSIRAEARIEEKFLSEGSYQRIVCILVGGIGRQGRQTIDPQIAQIAPISPFFARNTSERLASFVEDRQIGFIDEDAIAALAGEFTGDAHLDEGAHCFSRGRERHAVSVA